MPRSRAASAAASRCSSPSLDAHARFVRDSRHVLSAQRRSSSIRRLARLVKGESLADTVRNLDAIGMDVLVMRHHRAGAPYVAARYFGGSVVNAGDGWHAHPTQALLDLLDAAPALGRRDPLRGRKVVIVGDLRHSRVARSNRIDLDARRRRCLGVRTGRTGCAAWPGNRRLRRIWRPPCPEPPP